MSEFKRQNADHRGDFFSASAPGRVNLIGEHTDYNSGFVLPVAIPQETYVSLKKRNDREIRVFSENYCGQDQRISFSLDKISLQKDWANYIRGTVKLLQDEGFTLGGCDLHIRSEVPVGSGLSSSAALDVALIKVFREAYSLNIDDLALAKLCQKVENDFVGARVGILDPMACNLASSHQALFLDTLTLEYRRVTIPESLALIVVNSGIKHHNAAAGGYNERRAQCEEACRVLEIHSLREIMQIEPAHIRKLSDLLLKRVRHVVTENHRVVEAVAALEIGDLPRLGELFNQSHESLRDDYAVSIPEIDSLVAMARNQIGVFGARMTGGGFGGSVVAICEADKVHEVAKNILTEYQRAGHEQASLILPHISDTEVQRTREAMQHEEQFDISP